MKLKHVLRINSILFLTPRNSSDRFACDISFGAMAGDKALTELAQTLEVHPNVLTGWKRQLSDGLRRVWRWRYCDGNDLLI
jgi:hypothetical protein